MLDSHPALMVQTSFKKNLEYVELLRPLENSEFYAVYSFVCAQTCSLKMNDVSVSEGVKKICSQLEKLQSKVLFTWFANIWWFSWWASQRDGASLDFQAAENRCSWWFMVIRQYQCQVTCDTVVCDKLVACGAPYLMNTWTFWRNTNICFLTESQMRR